MLNDFIKISCSLFTLPAPLHLAGSPVLLSPQILHIFPQLKPCHQFQQLCTQRSQMRVMMSAGDTIMMCPHVIPDVMAWVHWERQIIRLAMLTTLMIRKIRMTQQACNKVACRVTTFLLCEPRRRCFDIQISHRDYTHLSQIIRNIFATGKSGYTEKCSFKKAEITQTALTQDMVL